ncbi:hypothetical protein [Tissierella sp. Yu-01]|uniref:hypothetical protein n=1 Tax=Tissierella sp. Yu-01 TaxID=3035694 RepID=UPI00240E06CB|nr:hypothetical protein [Tissierella sp. Yu-01]WFA07617.1 hypothetical protein P3962_07625 [Tissierella sp. Yu-01]
MNHTIAKVRQRTAGTKYRKILSGETLYTLPTDFTGFVAYDPNHNLDEDSWFGIEKFSEQEYCLDILKKNFVSAEYNTKLKHDEVKNIDFIFTYQDSNVYCFQNVTRSQLKRRKYITVGDDFKFKPDSTDISINELPDAIYVKDKDTLHFKKLSSISGIFDGISILYREATKEETKGFLENKFISLQNDFSVDDVKQANRKRVALAIDKLNSYDASQKKAVFKCIKDYYPKLINKSGAFMVSNDDELKLLLYGIDQRFYTTPDGRERRIANSVIPITT